MGYSCWIPFLKSVTNSFAEPQIIARMPGDHLIDRNVFLFQPSTKASHDLQLTTA